jgi:transposase-like protein
MTELHETDGLLPSGASIGQVCQQLQVADTTFHRWRSADPNRRD